MSQDNSQAELLQALINSGRFRLPLCHSHALEIVALLSGSKDWNTMAAGPEAITGKARAKALRAVVDECGAAPISIEVAARALTTPPSTPAAKTTTKLPDAISSPILGAPIRFVRADWGRGEWQVENPNALAEEELDELLERGRDDDRFMERKGEPLLRRFSGDLDLINSVAVAKSRLGKQAEAASLWRQGWNLASAPLKALLKKSPRAKLSYSTLENRPFYRVLHGHVMSLWADRSPESTDEAIKLSGMAFQLGRDRDGVGFRLLHVSYLADVARWTELVEFVDSMDRGNQGRFEIAALRAAAASMLGHDDADRRFADSLKMNPWGFEILANGVPVPKWEGGEGITLGSWEEGADLIKESPSVWNRSPVKNALERLRPHLLDEQIDHVRNLQRAQAHFNDPARSREYLASFRTPKYTGMIPVLDEHWHTLWPDLRPLARD